MIFVSLIFAQNLVFGILSLIYFVCSFSYVCSPMRAEIFFFFFGGGGGGGGGRVVRRCWVNFQCRGVLLIWIIVGQGPVALAVGAGGGFLDIFFETARYRLKYCLKGPLNPKQPTNRNFEIKR